jgi:delta24-sterol reductase
VSGFLNRLLVSQGYTLPIVPELDMLTIGKSLNGFSVKIPFYKHRPFR